MKLTRFVVDESPRQGVAIHRALGIALPVLAGAPSE
jgi:hypothetical protein